MLDPQSFVTCLEVIHDRLPNGRTLVTELVYRLDNSRQIVPGTKLTSEQTVCLQALLDYRKPQEQRGNSLEEMDPTESKLFDALALALRGPELQRELQAFEMVLEAHKPVCFNEDRLPGCISDPEQEEELMIIHVDEHGPNWSNRNTIYHLALEPEMYIISAFSPCGEHSFNHHFQQEEWYPDESGCFYDFPGFLARLWSDLDWIEDK